MAGATRRIGPWPGCTQAGQREVGAAPEEQEEKERGKAVLVDDGGFR